MNKSNNQKSIEICKILNLRLADSIDLYHQLKQMHWNIKGRNFIQFHELLDEVAGSILAHMDLIAERIVQLKSEASGTLQMATKKSTMQSYILKSVKEIDVMSYATNIVREWADKCKENIDEVDDPVTADILTEITREADKYRWILESHLE